jgi:Tfp pilus assembly PilM family ATPase
MAKLNQCLGIDIGTHSIRVAEVAAGPKGIEVKRLIEARIKLEPGQREGERQAAILSQLNALLKEHKIKTKAAVFCVPGQTVFVRPTVKIPATTPDRLNQIIRFEAREQIPFPLEKTKLEYQVFETDDPAEVEVLLVAIRRDHINQFMGLVRRSGLKPLAVSVSSLALHNFHEVNDSKGALLKRLEKPKKKKVKKTGKATSAAASSGTGTESTEARRILGLKLPKISLPSLGRKKKAPAVAAGPEPGDEAGFEAEDVDAYGDMELEEIQAEVNLGASLTDLAISKAGSRRLIGFTRTFPVAGSQVDRVIRTKLGLDSQEEAQRLKEQEAVVLASDFDGRGGHYNQDASVAATSAVDGIVTEIRRSLDYYISQPDGVAVDKLALSGGLTRLRHLNSYIEEKLGIPTFFASVANDDIQVPDELADAVRAFVIPLGLAFQGLGLAQVTIDFLPQEFKNIRQFKQKRGLLIAAGCLALASIGLGTQLGSRYIDQNRNLTQQYLEYIRANEDQTRTISEAQKENAELAENFETLSRVQADRALWLDFTVNLLQRRPGPILIERLEIGVHGAVELQGRTSRQQAISEFYNELRQETDYIRTAELTFLGAPEDDSRFPTRVFPFTMSITTYNRTGRFESMKIEGGAPLGTVVAEAEEDGDAEDEPAPPPTRSRAAEPAPEVGTGGGGTGGTSPVRGFGP